MDRQAERDSLDRLLRPRSVAILGASAEFDKLNGRTVKALIDTRYAGAIYPVNPKYREIGGIACYPDIAAIPGEIDLAIIALPARLAADAVRELGRRHAGAAIIFSAGFGETGDHARATELAAAIRDSGVRVLGPNCLGFINAFDRVMATFTNFAKTDAPPGPLALVTQSGALGTALAAEAGRRGLNFGYLVTTGNEADVGLVEVMDRVLDDPRIVAGAGFVEGVRDGDRFRALADKALGLGKPLILAKLGRTPAGARAIASHTGSLAGAEAIFEGVARQHGIVRARGDAHMLDLLQAFAVTPLPAGGRLAIMTRSGGAGALMADRGVELGLTLAALADATRERLAKVVPSFGSIANPVDITPQAQVDKGIIPEVLSALLSDPGVDLAIAWIGYTPDWETHVAAFAEARANSSKPFLVAWPSVPEEAQVALAAAGVAALRSPETAIEAAAALVDYGAARARRGREAAPPAPTGRIDLPAGAGVVPTMAAARLLAGAGVALAPAILATTPEEAVAAAERLGYPVALKIESRDIPHKTEAGGVRLALADRPGVRAAFVEVAENARRFASAAVIDGVIVQRMFPAGVELAVGVQRDAAFGPVVMAGLGGVFIEVLADVAFRAAPITEAEAGRMLDQLRGKALLDGVRGAAPVDKAGLVRLIAAVSRFAAAAGPRLLALDLNPVLATSAGVVAVDWLMVLVE